MKVDELPLVEIEWDDAALDLDTSGEPGAEGDLVVVRDIGYLVSANRLKITLAVGITPSENEWRHENVIPTALVRRARLLEAGPWLTKTQLLKTVSSTVTKKKTAHLGSTNGSDSTSPSTIASSTTQSRKGLSP